MKDLENLKRQVEQLEVKAMIYKNELGDELRVSMIDAQIKALNSIILEHMTLEQSLARFEAFSDNRA
jgi:hypothetical protein